MNIPHRRLGAAGLLLAVARAVAVALGLSLLTGCGGGTEETALAPATESKSADGIAPPAEPPPVTLACRADEGVAGQTGAPPVGQAGGKARPKLVLSAIQGVDPARYQVVDRSPSSVEFVREDDRYAITVIKFSNGTWFEEKRQYCLKLGRPSDQVPAP